MTAIEDVFRILHYVHMKEASDFGRLYSHFVLPEKILIIPRYGRTTEMVSQMHEVAGLRAKGKCPGVTLHEHASFFEMPGGLILLAPLSPVLSFGVLRSRILYGARS